MAIIREQLDVSLNSKNQSERHIMTIERENVGLRKLLKKHNIDVEKEYGKEETLFSSDREFRDKEIIKRSTTLLMGVMGFGAEVCERATNYLNGTAEFDSLEKDFKQFVLRKNGAAGHQCVEDTPHEGPCTMTVTEEEPIIVDENVDIRSVTKPLVDTFQNKL